MSLLIYTQYTKPEGTIKFDDLVMKAKKIGLKFLSLTDHGNFSGITEFYSKCLDSGIKPIIGIDFFCKLENEKYLRVIAYMKNYEGYKSLLKIVEKLRINRKSFYCHLDDLSDLKNCFLCLSSYRIDLLSENMDIETDFRYIQSQFSLLNFDPDDLFYHILFDDDAHNDEITKELMGFHSGTNIQLLGSNPVYYLEEGGHKIKDFIVKLTGERVCEKQFRKQYLGHTEEVLEKFPESSIVNMAKIVKSCHFIIEDAPIKFPELKLKGNIYYSCFETLRGETNKILSDQKDELKDLVHQELAYIRKYNIADIILFLIEVKTEFLERYNRNLFFSGFINDLHVAYMFNLTLSSPIFATSDYHRAVLANKKLHPQITVVVSPENRSNLFEYLSNRFHKDSICFLSEYVKWHFTTILNSLEKEYEIEKSLIDLLNKHYNKNYRSAGQLTDILNIKEVDEELKKYPDQKVILQLSILLDDAFKNYNTNTNQIVISNDNVKTILPIGTKNSDTAINSSFYNMSTAKHFGVWNINIESSNYLDIRKYFKLSPIRE
ncbi:MAG: PHP domain-containing protein [Candidatus Delongbacteria bacterium]|nr:PHP domain-containing protein [Candidatus Delongbacteria bacterium]